MMDMRPVDSFSPCYTLRHEMPASDQTCHVLHRNREADLITRFETRNADVVLVIDGVEVAELTKKCVPPVVGLAPLYWPDRLACLSVESRQRCVHFCL